MLLSPTAIGTVTEIISAADFYRDKHQTIYRAMLALWGKGEPVDAITLANMLDERGELADVGGGARIAELAALVPATSNVDHYARIVKEMATLRGLVRVGMEIARLGQERRGETADLVDRAEQIVFDLSQQRVTGDFAHIEELLKESFERITHLYEAGSDMTGSRAASRTSTRHGRVPTGEPRHPRGATVDGEVGARPLHRRQPRRPPPDPGGAVHARDVEVRGDAAADVQRGEGRLAAIPHRSADARTTGHR